MSRVFARNARWSLSRRISRIVILATLFTGEVAKSDEPRETKDLAEKIVDAMNILYGRHPGFRSTHAKGIVCEGEFFPASSASTLSRAPHLQDKPVRATIRFSDSAGIPTVSDGDPVSNPHGLAVRFYIPDGGHSDIVSNAYNGFAVSTAEDLLLLLKAISESKPEAPKPRPIEQFLATHPKAMKVATARKPTPVSYATEPYFGVNAFRFTNKDGKARYGRYQFHPEAGVHFLQDEDAAKKHPNFLTDELIDRLSKGPVKFRLMVQLAAEGDRVNDATVVWPDDRPTIELGTLYITHPASDNNSAERALDYDPLRLVDGIDASDDPLLAARSAAYAASRRRRR